MAVGKATIFPKDQWETHPANVVRAAGATEHAKQATVGLYLGGQQIGGEEDEQRGNRANRKCSHVWIMKHSTQCARILPGAIIARRATFARQNRYKEP